MFLVVKKDDPRDKPASHAFYALGFVFFAYSNTRWQPSTVNEKLKSFGSIVLIPR